MFRNYQKQCDLFCLGLKGNCCFLLSGWRWKVNDKNFQRVTKERRTKVFLKRNACQRSVLGTFKCHYDSFIWNGENTQLKEGSYWLVPVTGILSLLRDVIKSRVILSLVRSRVQGYWGCWGTWGCIICLFFCETVNKCTCVRNILSKTTVSLWYWFFELPFQTS